MNDKKLVEKILAGDDTAFEQLVKIYLKPIYNFLYRLTGDSSTLDDLTQETFIKVWKNLSRFDQSKKFRTWIFTIGRNTAYDFLKKKKSIPFTFFEDGEGNNRMNEIADEKILASEVLEKADAVKDIEKSLKKIPRRYRVILIMRYKDDFSLGEIAEILGKPYNTVKSQHQRALRCLKKVITETP